MKPALRSDIRIYGGNQVGHVQNARVSEPGFETPLQRRYRQVRAAMPALAQGLSPEDLGAQSMADASPGKWHLGHTSWFFEAMILGRDAGYEPVDPRFQTLFNSYYESVGARVARPERGLMTRPSLDEVLAYRAEIDRRMMARLADGLDDPFELYLLELGLHHDQQHQELFLMDLLHLMSRSPLDPAAYGAPPRPAGPVRRGVQGARPLEGGLIEIGAAPEAAFAFDNEGPRHRSWLEPYRLARGLVTNADWMRFMADDGYGRSELWLSDGWATVAAEGWRAPMYWREEAEGWSVMTLAGRVPVDAEAPVRHVSFYEADAYARWAGARLPTEVEWEHAVTEAPDAFVDAFGEAWQWTASAYAPYRGFTPTPGTASEYNGKFMANQMVLRGGCFATPAGHERVTYRNFYYPQQRWMFAGVRLAWDDGEDAKLTDFAREVRDGLSATPKALSPKWFYDAEGSRLFEAITRLPEYYPTRQEMGLLKAIAPELADAFGPAAVLVEYGSGASEKTRILLDAADIAAYAPIDISETALQAAARRIRADYPHIQVLPIVGDFMDVPGLPDGAPAGRRIGFFPGSTIGNLDEDEAVAFLTAAKRLLGEGASFLLGVDLVKDEATLVRAYDDAQGVTAAFNLNLIARMRRELGVEAAPDDFRHRAVWNAQAARVEMHLEAQRDLSFEVAGRQVRFARGETVHTESSRKFTEARVRDLAEAAGWRVNRFYTSAAPSVALALLDD